MTKRKVDKEGNNNKARGTNSNDKRYNGNTHT